MTHGRLWTTLCLDSNSGENNTTQTKQAAIRFWTLVHHCWCTVTYHCFKQHYVAQSRTHCIVNICIWLQTALCWGHPHAYIPYFAHSSLLYLHSSHQFLTIIFKCNPLTSRESLIHKKLWTMSIEITTPSFQYLLNFNMLNIDISFTITRPRKNGQKLLVIFPHPWILFLSILWTQDWLWLYLHVILLLYYSRGDVLSHAIHICYFDQGIKYYFHHWVRSNCCCNLWLSSFDIHFKACYCWN